MGLLDPKPAAFKEGARSLSAEQLNALREAVPRQVRGAGVNAQEYGDRLTINYADPHPSLPGPANYVKQFVVISEGYDLLVCTPFLPPDDSVTLVPQLYDDTLGSGSASYAVLLVAKPFALQKTPWDGKTVVVNADTVTYAYGSLDERTATSTSAVNETLRPGYMPGDVILAARTLTGYAGDDSFPVVWMDVNTAGRRWVPEDTGDVSNSTINVTNTTVNYFNTLFTFISTVFNVSDLTINYGPSGFGGVTFNAWLEICGYQFWCCRTHDFGTGTIIDWKPPGAATVYPVTSSGTQLDSIVPVGISSSLQVTPAGKSASGLVATAVFPRAVTPGSTVIVRVWGKSTAALTTPAVLDNTANVYTQDRFLRDATSGVYVGIWRFSVVGGGVTSVTFSYTGNAGPIEVVAEERTGLDPAPVDVFGSAAGTSAAPAPGAITPSFPYEVIALGMASAAAFNPTTVTPPAGAANLGKETDGVNSVVGSSDYHATGDVSTYTPAYALGASAPWVAVYVAYKMLPGPQLLSLVNVGVGPLILRNGGGFTAGLGRPLNLPDKYHDPVAGVWKVTLEAQDSILLWLDGCVGSRWETLACTANGFGVYDALGTLNFEPHLAFDDGTLGDVIFTVNHNHADRLNRVIGETKGKTGNYEVVVDVSCSGGTFVKVTSIFTFRHGLLVAVDGV